MIIEMKKLSFCFQKNSSLLNSLFLDKRADHFHLASGKNILGFFFFVSPKKFWVSFFGTSHILFFCFLIVSLSSTPMEPRVSGSEYSEIECEDGEALREPVVHGVVSSVPSSGVKPRGRPPKDRGGFRCRNNRDDCVALPKGTDGECIKCYMSMIGYFYLLFFFFLFAWVGQK